MDFTSHLFLSWTMTSFILFVQDIYCLDADGALFDAALLSAVAAFSHCKIHILFFLCTSFVLAVGQPANTQIKASDLHIILLLTPNLDHQKLGKESSHIRLASY